jgi:hypothetical protein
VFTHDDFMLGGGRADVITTQNAIAASVSQSAFSLTYGPTGRFDISLGVPLIRTSITAGSDATIHRIGTASNPAVHFFRDPAAPGTYGNTRRFAAHGSAMGLGDIIGPRQRHHAQAPAPRRGDGRRGAHGNRQRGESPRVRVKGYQDFRSGVIHVRPHLAACERGLQWNGNTVLAGDVATAVQGDLPDETFFVVGADVAVEQRLSMAFELLGRHSSDSPRLARRTFTVPGTSESFSDISFTSGSLNAISGAWV